MFISVTFRILSFRTLSFIPQKKIPIKFSANYSLTTFRIPRSAFRKIPLPTVTGQLADTPTRGLPTRGLDISRTGQLAD